MGEAEEEVLRVRECRGCGVRFFVCRPCDRGQQYCSEACREPARTAQRSAARLRHQRSPEGREDHRDHQRAYRERGRLVMDHPSAPPVEVETLAAVSPGVSDAPDEKEAGGGHWYEGTPSRPECRFCGRKSVWIEWG